jgi:hypothetical protein
MKRDAARLHRAWGIALAAAITAGTCALLAGIAIAARMDRNPDPDAASTGVAAVPEGAAATTASSCE